MRRSKTSWLEDAVCKVCGESMTFDTSRRVDASRDGFPTGTCYRVCSKKCVTAYKKEEA